MKQIEQLLKNIFLKLLLLFSSRKSGSNRFDQNSKILIIRLNRIGDALVTTPLLHLLKNKLNCYISVLADKKNHFVFSNNPNVDDLVVFEKGISGFFKVRNYIKKNKIDIIIDAHYDVSTTVSFIIATSGTVNKFAIKKDNHTLYSKTVESPDARNTHIIDRLKIIGNLFNISSPNDDSGVELFPDSNSVNLAEEWLSIVNPEKKFLMGINISAGSEARFWGFENYKMLIQLLDNFDVEIVIFAMQDYISAANDLIGNNKVFPIEYGFNATCAAVLNLDLLFSPDTALIHIASIKKIPVFGIYVQYKTSDMIWSPYNTPFDCIITKEQTLNNVYFDSVKEKFVPFLEKHIK